MFVFSTVLLTVSGVGINYLFKYIYPEYYKNLWISLLYQIIYYYSSLEMVYLKFNKKYKKLQNSTLTIEFVKNGKITDECSEYDFIIYSENNCKKRINDLSEKKTGNKSNVSFILCNITINTDISLNFNFLGDTYNYCLCGNIIDKQFLWFFLNKHYNLNLTEPLVNYTMTIIDNNINMYTLTPCDSFEIMPDKIRLFTNDNGKITNNMVFNTNPDTPEIIEEFAIELKERREEPAEVQKKEQLEEGELEEEEEAEVQKEEQLGEPDGQFEKQEEPEDGNDNYDFVKETI